MPINEPLSEHLGGLMVALMYEVLIGAGASLIGWLALEPVLIRLLPRLERILPRDVIGPDAWLSDTSNQTGIFDLASKRGRRGIR